MKPAEFEERAYEAPLYNQLERGERNIFTPGLVLQGDIGFDRGIDIAEHGVVDDTRRESIGCHHMSCEINHDAIGVGSTATRVLQDT